jgi:glycosyltransferase involved in cell wall biosynthesis
LLEASPIQLTNSQNGNLFFMPPHNQQLTRSEAQIISSREIVTTERFTDDRTASRRLKVLMSAYACEPGKGSEPGVGWNVASEVAKLHDVWVLTRANNREVIEAELAQHPVSGLHFIYYDLPKWAMWWKKGGRGVQLYYYLWEVFSARTVRGAEKQIGFDVAHHVTIVRYWTPSNLRNVTAPLVWGPVGGGESTPPAFKRTFSAKNQIVEGVRDLMRRLAECDPLLRKTARKSCIALATTKETASRLNQLNVKKVHVLSQLGMASSKNWINEREGCGLVRFICIGKQVYWKGFDLAVKAFAAAGVDDSELILVGEGSEHSSLQNLAQTCGVAERVSFEKWMDQKALHKLLDACDVLVHPSFHDSGAFVCLEAMSMSKPVICLDLGGPSVQVTDKTGFKIKAEAPQQLMNDLADAMQQLATNSDLRQSMGDAARKRVGEHFLWSKKAEYFSNLYFDVLSVFNEAYRIDSEN